MTWSFLALAVLISAPTLSAQSTTQENPRQLARQQRSVDTEQSGKRREKLRELAQRGDKRAEAGKIGAAKRWLDRTAKRGQQSQARRRAAGEALRRRAGARRGAGAQGRDGQRVEGQGRRGHRCNKNGEGARGQRQRGGRGRRGQRGGN